MTIKDVIRMARKADYNKVTPLILTDLVIAVFTLVTNSYIQVFKNSGEQGRLVLLLINEFWTAMQRIATEGLIYGWDLMKDFVRFLLSNVAGIKKG